MPVRELASCGKTDADQFNANVAQGVGSWLREFKLLACELVAAAAFGSLKLIHYPPIPMGI